MARALRRLAVLVAVLVGLLVAAVAGVRLWLETGHGERFAARQVTERVSAAVEGELSAERVGLRGLSGVVAEDVVLRSPEGAPIARARRVEAGVGLRELYDRGAVVLRDLEVDGLVLDVVVPEDDTPDLLRALRGAAAEQVRDVGRGEGTPLELTLHDARIGIERLAVRRAAGAEPVFAAASGEIAGDLEVAGDRLDADLSIRLSLLRPIDGPVELAVTGRLDGARLELSRLSATLPGAIQVSATAAADEGSPAPLDALSIAPLDLSLSLPAEGLVPFGGPALAGPVDLDGRLSYAGGRLELAASVRPPGPGEIRVDASLVPGEPRGLSVLLDARGVDPARIRGAPPAARVWAALRLHGALALPPDAHLEGRLWVARSRLAGEPVGPGRARVAVRGGRVAVDRADLAIPGGRVRGRLAVGGEAPIEADLAASLARVEALVESVRALGFDVPDAEGVLDARLRARGEGRARRLSLELAAPHLALAGRHLSDVEARVALQGAGIEAHLSAETLDGPLAAELRGERTAPERVRLSVLSLALFGMDWRLGGPATVDWAGGGVAVAGLVLHGPGVLRVDATVPGGGSASRALRADVVAEGVPLAVLEPLRPEGLPEGAADARVRVRGTLRSPKVELSAAVRAQAREEEAVLEASLEGDRRAARGELRVAVNGAPAARLDAALRAGRGSDLASPSGLLGADVEASLQVHSLDAGVLARLGVPLGPVRGTLEADLSASGRLSTAAVSGDVRIADVVVLDHPELGRLPPLAADLRLDAMPRMLEVTVLAEAPGAPPLRGAIRVGRSVPELVRGADLEDAPLEGRFEIPRGPLALPRLDASADALALRARVAGTVGAPDIEATAELEALVVDEAPLGSLRVRGRASPGGARLALRLEASGGGLFVADAEAPAGAPWRTTIEAREASLDLLRILPQAPGLEGAVADGRLELRGGPAPTADGELTIGARRVVVEGFGTLREVVVDLRASEARLEIRRIAAELLGGRAEASGEIAWWEGGGRASLRIDAESFPVPRELRPLGELTTRADVAVALDGRRVDGTVALSRGEVRLAEGGPGELHPTSLPPTYVVHGGDEPPAEAKGREPPFVGRVRITIPRDFWVRSEAVNLEVTTDLVGRLEDDRLAFTGELRVPRGNLKVLARKFEVERLGVSFTGDPELDPYVDGRLAHEQPSLRVWIELSGRLREPELTLTSEPPMDPDQIALAVAAGRAVEPGAGMSGAVLAGALNVVAGEVGQALTENLPIDVLEVELGPGGEARRLEAGTYLTPRLFLSFVRNVFALPDENENEVRAEYQLGRSVSLSSHYGDRQSGALNLLWERRFRSGAQRDAGVAPATEGGSGAGSLGGGPR